VSEWAAIEFKDDRDACTFTAMVSLTKVHQETINAPKKGPIGGGKSWNAPENAPINQLQVQLMHLIAGVPAISYDDMAEKLGKDRTTIMRNVQKLKRLGYLRRTGTKRAGHWEVS